MRRLALSVVAVAMAGALAGCASTGSGAGMGAPTSTIDRIKATKTILLGYRDSSVPFSYADQNRVPTGYSVDLCQRVVEDLRRDLKLPDLQPKWVPVTVESRVAAVVSGTIDLECGSTTNTLSRQEQVDFSLTTFITGASLLALAGSNVGSELAGTRIAVVPGTTTETLLKDALSRAGVGANQAQLVNVKDHADGLLAVSNRSADVYATDRAILIGLVLSTPQPERFALLDRYLSYEPYALMLRRGDPAFRLAVNRALARLYRTAQVVDIYRKWFGAWGPPSALTLGLYAIEGLPRVDPLPPARASGLRSGRGRAARTPSVSGRARARAPWRRGARRPRTARRGSRWPRTSSRGPHRDVGVAGDEDDRQVPARRLEPPVELESRLPGHPHVEDEAARPLVLGPIEELRHRAEDLDAVPGGAQEPMQAPPHRLVVVHDEDHRRRVGHAARPAGSGRRKRNVAPWPLFSAQMRPPCASMIERAMASPMPMPAFLVV